MNVLSLFDGISAGRIALERAGVSVDNFYSSEIDEHAIKVTQRNHPSTIQLGDATKWKEWDIDFSSVDLIMAGFPCFAKGTLVMTSNGLKPIEEIDENDYVLTHTHSFKRVVVPMVKTSNHINRVKIQGSHELLVTDEHPFYVRKRTYGWDNKNRSNIRLFGKPEWVNCSELNKECFVGVAINQNEIIPKFNSDENFWYMIGRYVADGYSSTENLHSRGEDKGNRRVYKTIITCGKHEVETVDDLILKTGYKATKSEEKTSYKFTISDKDLWEFIQQFGRGAEDKEIPGFLHDMPNNLIDKFLEGYISGDGYSIKSNGTRSNKNTYQITTISKYLAYGVEALIQKCYRTQPSITLNKVPNKKIIEGRLVNQKPFYSIRLTKEKQKLANYFVEDGFIWTPFKSKLREDVEIEVYNFEVDDDNSYSVNNLIVHNCQAWSIAGQQGGVEDERGQLLHTMMDIFHHIKEKNPNLKFLFENVKMKKVFQEYVNSVIGVEPIVINSRLVSAQNRPRQYWTNIPGVEQPEDKGIVLRDIILTSFNEKIGEEMKKMVLSDKANDYMGRLRNGKPRWDYHTNPLDGKAACLTANMYKGVPYGVIKELGRRLHPIECERLQTFPDGYTEGISMTQRFKALGNSWTVDVIAHIFKGLK